MGCSPDAYTSQSPPNNHAIDISKPAWNSDCPKICPEYNEGTYADKPTLGGLSMSGKRLIIGIRKRLILLCLCVAVIVMASACFRDTAEAIQEQPVARQVVSPTAIDTDEPLPSATSEISEVISTEAPPDTFALTATALIARLTEVAAPASADRDSEAADAAVSASEQPAPAATAVPLIRATVPPGEDCIHEIRSGETLFMLSLAYGSTVDAIAAASDIENPDRIAIGQRITVPGCGTSGFAPPPTSLPPPTTDPNAVEPTAVPELEIASNTGEGEEVSALVLQAQEAILSNAQASLGDGFTALSAASATPSQTYTVQEGDTLLIIALRFNTTIDILAALNGIDDVDDVAVGDVLKIP